MKYVTVVATVKVPTDVSNDVIEDVVRKALERTGGEFVPCNWAPDPDTIADQTDGGIDFDALTVIDVNGPVL